MESAPCDRGELAQATAASCSPPGFGLGLRLGLGLGLSLSFGLGLSLSFGLGLGLGFGLGLSRGFGLGLSLGFGLGLGLGFGVEAHLGEARSSTSRLHSAPMSIPPARLLIVTTGDPIPSVRERRGSFADMIRRAIGPVWTGEYAFADARDGTFPQPGEADAFLLTGSPANVPDRDPWIVRTEGWLRDLVGSGVPVFGICFGHQILAHALGGECVRNPKGREFGTVFVDQRQDEPLFAGVPRRFQANVTHVDTVGRLPPGAVSLARSEQDEHQAIRFTPTCYGVQYHPEIDAEIMRGYIEGRRETLDAERFDVEALLDGVTEAEAGRRTMHNFLRHVVFPRLA
ncbi:glutamine amidotransferase [Chondromyces crocatus]|uniref:Glutamine amidotransferase domain-containing protein n=1 Tax=Chondromyces crocatus TaxID=52 RepID=A0A0K1EBT4_CHOCO|nr:glutamine amidotransferase [Chondromyces crocatus]AKT38314.1 uncharacterized protein CMC5_024590 [Chondromyces crocatus]